MALSTWQHASGRCVTAVAFTRQRLVMAQKGGSAFHVLQHSVRPLCTQDGLLSYNMRELANMPDDNPKWILLDGDLDANWVESMNSVMDDSRLLTLPSNERIRLLPHMKMIFEIRDLKYATPATATRAGILYISEGRQWHNMVQSWLSRVARPYAEKAKWKVRDTHFCNTPLLFTRCLQAGCLNGSLSNQKTYSLVLRRIQLCRSRGCQTSLTSTFLRQSVRCAVRTGT
jgi:hypothetical protein